MLVVERAAWPSAFSPRTSGTFQGGSTVLIITRRAGERIMVGDEIAIEVMEIVGSSVRIGISAPRSVPVYREEIYRAVRDENRAAADAASIELPPQTT
jgi:carbon storage regulator